MQHDTTISRFLSLTLADSSIHHGLATMVDQYNPPLKTRSTSIYYFGFQCIRVRVRKQKTTVFHLVEYQSILGTFVLSKLREGDES
jgi:hypothetical protein